MEFRILRPLEVADDGAVVALGGLKQRSLLAILLLSANEVVSSDRLIDQLWGERSPESGRTALQVRVSQLRKALGAAGAQLLTRPPGYVVEVDRGQLDLHRFERLVLEADTATPVVAAAKLREGLELWRGEPLADLSYELFAQPAIARMQELRLTAIEKRIEADLAVGRHAELVGELEPLVTEHPLRERLAGQLMLALYHCGRQADALAVYRKTGERLRDELGLEPGPGLQDLERAILQHDSALGSVSPPAPDRQPHAAAAAQAHLPVPATAFLGRACELTDVTTLLRRPATRLLTLTGAGGSGKTRLALRAADESAANYRDGAWFVGFANIADPELIVATICQTLGLREQPGVTSIERVEGWLKERELLLLLDNLEQLTEGSAPLGELIAACPGLTLLVTSREPLHLTGEQQYQVPVLAHAEAVELFTARAKAIAPHRRVEAELAGQICQRLDCLPLAIELAAARTKALSQTDVLTRLRRRLPLLTGGPRDAPRRQRNTPGDDRLELRVARPRAAASVHADFGVRRWLHSRGGGDCLPSRTRPAAGACRSQPRSQRRRPLPDAANAA
jgi:DNA-binding SARP family transcriptional activator